MKKFLIILLGLIHTVAIAQHQGHTMPDEPKIIPKIESYPDANINSSKPKTIRYNLIIDDTVVNYSGKKRKAIQRGYPPNK